MIVTTKDGRRKSILTSGEISSQAASAVSDLSQDEVDLLMGLVLGEEETQIEATDEMLSRLYHTTPVSMEQFIEDPYYLGESCETLYPQLRQDLIDLFDYPYREVVLTGGIGVGKTYVLSIALCRVLYLLSCLTNPQKVFGLSSGTEMVIPLISKNLILARDVMKTAVDDKIKESPYFMTKFTPRISKESTVFPNNIKVIIGSYTSERVLGTNVIACGLDETNFPPTRKAQQITTGFGKKRTAAHFDVVEKVYQGLARRIKSRFLNRVGDFPGMVILASSAATLESFTERKMEASENDSKVFVRDHTPWTVKPGDSFCGEKFWVVCSTSSLQARILDESEYDTVTDEWLEENEAWLLDIPIEYRTDFEIDIENALRDIAGISTQALSIFIQRRDAVDDCVNPGRSHPFSVYEWTAGGLGHFKWEELCRKFERRLPGGYTEEGYAPKINPKALRWCHIDTSLSGDCSGFCVGHVDRWVEVVRRDEDGTRYTDLAPFYIMDVMLRINPPQGEQIYLPDVRQLLYSMMNHGFSFMGFSTDTYMYAEMHQQVKRKGIRNVEIISMDTSVAPYNELKSAVYEGRIDYYKYEPFIEEFKALEYDRLKGKIDHPQSGSKDCVSGDTKISLLNGTEVPIRDLVGKEFWVYSCTENGDIVPGKARNVHLVGDRKVVRVWLDNGEYFDCTGDHEIMMRDGTYREASCLVAGDSLMPLYRKTSLRNPKCGLNGYEQVLDNRSGKYVFTHQLVAGDVNGFSYVGNIEGRMVLHHSDFDKRNNDPSNLVAMEWNEHRELHCRVASENMKQMWKDDNFRTAAIARASELGKRTGVENITKYNKSKKRIESLRGKKVFSRNGTMVMRKLWKDEEFRERHRKRVSGDSNPFARKDVTFERIMEIASTVTSQAEILRELKCTQKVLVRVLRESGMTYSDVAKRFGHVRVKRGSESHHARKDVTIDKVLEVASKVNTVKDVCKELRCTPKVYHRVLLENGMNPIDFGKENFRGYRKNHKIVKIERNIGECDVYDMTVDRYHNFALSSGVFVHNCSDAAAGVVFGLLNGATRLPLGAGAGTHKKRGHEHSWVSPMIPASNLNIDEVLEEAHSDDGEFLSIIFGD